MKQAADSNVASHTAKVEPGHPDYADRVSKPMMTAVDAMPREFRELVHEFGYVDVYRAWRRGWTVSQIRDVAVGGRFDFPG